MEARGHRRLIRDINENLVFTVIHRFGPLSRADIARISGLSSATVSAIIRDLLGTGFVREIGSGESRGGRRPVLLEINPKAAFVIGVKLMEHSLATTLVDLEANIVVYRSFALDGVKTPEHVLEAVAEAADSLRREAQVGERLLGVGIGMAGVIDSERGICRYSPFFGWRDVDIAGFLQRHLPVPVYVDNDVNTLTVAEQWFGKGKGKRNFIVVTVGRGVGAGIVVNGSLCRGYRGGAGELGHVTVDEDGPLCHCGKRGCLGVLASDPAVEEEIQLRKGRFVPFEEIVALADSGDGDAREVLRRSGEYLGMGIALMVNLLAPELVVISGEGLKAGRWRLEPLMESLRKHIFNGLLDGVEVAVEPIGDEFWARGAAALVLEKLFSPPVHVLHRYTPLAAWVGKGGDTGDEPLGKPGAPGPKVHGMERR